MLTKSKIEYLTHNWGFWPGCLHQQQGICPVKRCWAHGNAIRFKGGGFTPRLIPEKLLDPLKGYNPKKARRIGVNFTGDLFGDWVEPSLRSGDKLVFPARVDYPQGWQMLNCPLRDRVFRVAEFCPADTFIFLTKRPDRLPQWSPFPNNCWVGASVCNQKMLAPAIVGLAAIQAKVKFISFEPILERIDLRSPYDLDGISGVFIGQQTPVRWSTTPKIVWIREIVEAADKAGAAVYLKDNLLELLRGCYGINAPYWSHVVPDFPSMDELRQEYPKEAKG